MVINVLEILLISFYNYVFFLFFFFRNVYYFASFMNWLTFMKGVIKKENNVVIIIR